MLLKRQNQLADTYIERIVEIYQYRNEEARCSRRVHLLAVELRCDPRLTGAFYAAGGASRALRRAVRLSHLARSHSLYGGIPR